MLHPFLSVVIYFLTRYTAIKKYFDLKGKQVISSYEQVLCDEDPEKTTKQKHFI